MISTEGNKKEQERKQGGGRNREGMERNKER